MDPALRPAVDRHLAHCPWPEDAEPLRALLERTSADPEAERILRECLTPLRFGTAGLRAPRGPGPGRINRNTLAVAVAATLSVWENMGWTGPRVVPVGRDARSKAQEHLDAVIEVIWRWGRPVVCMPLPCPTPLVSFAVRRFGAQGGFMVTASHNPPEYGGLKVFASEGAQIVEPFDREVEGVMSRIASGRLPMWPDESSPEPAPLPELDLGPGLEPTPDVPVDPDARSVFGLGDVTRPGTPGRRSRVRAPEPARPSGDGVDPNALEIRTDDVELPMAGSESWASDGEVDEHSVTEDLNSADLSQASAERLARRTEAAYVSAVRQLAEPVDPSGRGLTVAYTALCGVGSRLFREVVQGTRHRLVEVREQSQPDGRFPGLAAPNPEVPEALHALLETAELATADVALAHDPDGDRLAVAAPRLREGRTGFEILTGNAVGGLLAAGLLEAWSGPARPVLITSQVSSRFVDALAAARGARLIRTGTGFKWMARAAANLPDGQVLVLAFEEALGYAVRDLTRDKDGLAAARTLLRFHADWAGSCWDRWSALQAELGGFCSGQLTLPMEDASGWMTRLASDGLPLGPPFEAEGPAQAFDGAGRPVSVADGGATLWRQPLQDGAWVAVRPSGTEPKLKIYFEAVVAPGPDALERAEVRRNALAAAVRRALQTGGGGHRTAGVGPPDPAHQTKG
jgi:phosphomannomutase